MWWRAQNLRNEVSFAILDASTQGHASSTQVTAWVCVRESINEREKDKECSGT